MKKPYLTKLERSQFELPNNLKNILIGLLLGDLCAQKQTKNSNTMLRFIQGIPNKEYLLHLFELFGNYTRLDQPSIIDRSPDHRTGKIYNCIQFHTYALPCFNELHNLFYVNGKKVVPSNIGELLTPEGLAYWICDDGKHVASGGLTLCTNSFSDKEVASLIDLLVTRYGLICTIHKAPKGQHLIFISKKSMEELRSIVKPYIVPSMMYKVHL